MRLVHGRSPLGECEQRGDSRPLRRERRSHHVQASVCFSNCTFRNAAGLGAAVGDSYVSRREQCLGSESELGGTDWRFCLRHWHTRRLRVKTGLVLLLLPITTRKLEESWAGSIRYPSRRGPSAGLSLGTRETSTRRATHPVSAPYEQRFQYFSWKIQFPPGGQE
jgi:hypothetical protein